MHRKRCCRQRAVRVGGRSCGIGLGVRRLILGWLVLLADLFGLNLLVLPFHGRIRPQQFQSDRSRVRLGCGRCGRRLGLGLSRIGLIDQLLDISRSLLLAVLFRHNGSRIFVDLGIDGLVGILVCLLALQLGRQRENRGSGAGRGGRFLLVFGMRLVACSGSFRVSLRLLGVIGRFLRIRRILVGLVRIGRLVVDIAKGRAAGRVRAAARSLCRLRIWARRGRRHILVDRVHLSPFFINSSMAFNCA